MVCQLAKLLQSYLRSYLLSSSLSMPYWCIDMENCLVSSTNTSNRLLAKNSNYMPSYQYKEYS
jgi:hypothetical protein